jgi:hypothetical protein
VVLDIFSYEVISEEEYRKEWSEFAFRLNVQGRMYDNQGSVSLENGDRRYVLAGYLLQRSYYDAERKKEIVENYAGASAQLERIMDEMGVVTVTVEDRPVLRIAEYFDLKSVRVYRGTELWREEVPEAPFRHLQEWEPGDYVFICTVSCVGTGLTEVMEYAICLRLIGSGAEEDTTAEWVSDSDEPVQELQPMDRILANAEAMTPSVPSHAECVGETAVFMWYREDGSNLRKRVSRVAVFRDPRNSLVSYLYADVLTDDGRIIQCETQTVNGLFVLLWNEIDCVFVLATLEGAYDSTENTRTLYGMIETWLSWTDADALSGEDLGDVRILRVEYGNWTQPAPADFLKAILKACVKNWDRMESVLRKNGGAENFGVLIDCAAESSTPRIYSAEESMGTEARELCQWFIASKNMEAPITELWDRLTPIISEAETDEASG